MQTCVNIQTETENIFISTVLLPHVEGCTGEYTGKIVEGKAVITCGKCEAEHVVEIGAVEMDMIGAVENPENGVGKKGSSVPGL